MAHIKSIGAAMYSDLSVNAFDPVAGYAGLDTAAEFNALFAQEIPPATATPVAGDFIRITNVREFPAMGTPPNVVKVPVYGYKTSQQIQGQADAPDMTIKINMVPEVWAKDSTPASLLAGMVGDGQQYAFRFALLNTQPGVGKFASTPTGLGLVENSLYYWVGKMESLLVTPSLTDSTMADLSITIQSDFFGAWTV